MIKLLELLQFAEIGKFVISIWRRTAKSNKNLQFPPLWEDSHQTGVLVEQLIKEYGLLPRLILQETIAQIHSRIFAIASLLPSGQIAFNKNYNYFLL
jgi:hypothetical protein